MYSLVNSRFCLGSFELSHRLIQGPLAGFSCAPFRQMFSHFTPPAYSVSEMLSANDVIHKHTSNGRYLYRGLGEKNLCYQISGSEPSIMAEAALKLENLGADLLDINCGCPKTKIRKKGAGSALLESEQNLIAIIASVRAAIKCPLTVKVRLQGNDHDIELAKRIADAGVDALIVHGRRWMDDYDVPCDLAKIAKIKRALHIPVIANGDITDRSTLENIHAQTGCDAFMISRASTGKPWLFQALLSGSNITLEITERVALFMRHLHGLAQLENEYQAVLQSKSLVRYYFREQLTPAFLQDFYKLTHLQDIESILLKQWT
ncbi:MAG: tRNA-dihydrouridine synthase family protein [Legionellaceae bacterium]|nr:tRNA-dihydrouridine synthase family protein [Legionellaceae bacterium]